MNTILIIEDDPRIAEALAIRFRAGGYAALTAADAVSGLSQAVRARPDLILLDISLPGGNGLELAEKLRHLPETRNTPFIFVTASKDPALRAKAMALRAAGLFEKPYDAEELLAVAGHALGETGLFRRPRPPEHAFAPLRPAPPPAAKKILIVEDDRKIALALALRLRSAGYEATMAFDALSGVNLAVKLQPDLVLLDISMPAGNGFTVAERVQTLVPTPTPIIFLTASKQPGFRQRAEELGAVGFFEKPYEAGTIHADIRHTLAA